MIYAPSDNRLLATLQITDLRVVEPLLRTLSLEQGSVLFEMGEETENIYFPVSGMISLLVVMQDGRSIETATIGREGAVGLEGVLELKASRLRGVAQLPFTGFVMSARDFRKAARSSDRLRDLVYRSMRALLEQTQITAACNGLHTVDQRVCRWILQPRDCADSEVFALTQEILAEMLAVRRTSVTAAAQKLQDAGIIRYSRGKIEITNRTALERRSCECYSTIRYLNDDV